MQLAQEVSSFVLALRKKSDLRVRQPLQKILLPVQNEAQRQQFEQVKDLILGEVNVKEMEFVSDTSGLVTKSIKPDFKQLGKKLGAKMKAAAEVISQFTQADIRQLEQTGSYDLQLNGETFTIELGEVIIASQDIEGWLVNSTNGVTVALDVNVTDKLVQEGIARELVNRLQNLRKSMDFNVTDRIAVTLEDHELIRSAVQHFGDYIQRETLAERLDLSPKVNGGTAIELDEVELGVKVEVM